MLILVALAAWPAKARAGVDDYPASLKAAGLDAVLDPWRFYNRECTSFVAWRLNNCTVTVEEYNKKFTGLYSERRVAASDFVYIHVKDLSTNLSDGSFIGNGDGRVYELVGGAPLYVAASDANNVPGYGSSPVYGIDQWDLDNTADSHAHVRAYPGDGTFVANVADGRVYKIAGGAPIYVSAANASKVPGYGSQPVTALSFYEFANREHMLSAPADGTIVTEVPSGTSWVFSGSLRKPSAAATGAVVADDIGIAAFGIVPVTVARDEAPATAPSEPPEPSASPSTASQAPAPPAPTIRCVVPRMRPHAADPGTARAHPRTLPAWKGPPPRTRDPCRHAIGGGAFSSRQGIPGEHHAGVGQGSAPYGADLLFTGAAEFSR